MRQIRAARGIRSAPVQQSQVGRRCRVGLDLLHRLRARLWNDKYRDVHVAQNVLGYATYPVLDATGSLPPKHDQIRLPSGDVGKDLVGGVPEPMRNLDHKAALFEDLARLVHDSSDFLLLAYLTFRLVG
jgi:hypothetical protein